MGSGDWLMATARVRKLNEESGLPVLVVNGAGKPQWHEVFEGNPRITRNPATAHVQLLDGSGNRPYIAGKSSSNWLWKPWGIEPGEVYLTDSEKAFGGRHPRHILVEPNTKVPNSNKAWPWKRWQKLVDAAPYGVTYVQVGGWTTRKLNNVLFLHTSSFRQAMAVLSVCRAFVGTEGGLHHAAAALGIPAVVLFSEYISPDITGYPQHRNLRHAGLACGSRTPCAGCADSMQAISLEEVQQNLKEIL